MFIGSAIADPPLTTSVDTITPYNQTEYPVTINATGDAGLDNVTLWYRYSNANDTWTGLNYDSNWLYGREITVTNPIENYQTQIVIANSSGGDVNCSGNANSNFSDIRFATSNGTDIPFWMENYTADTQATFWVKNEYNDTTLYLYYGNANALNASNGSATFPWHFENWTTDNTGDYNEDTRGDGHGKLWTIPTTISDDFRMRFKFRPIVVTAGQFGASTQIGAFESTDADLPSGFTWESFSDDTDNGASSTTARVSSSTDNGPSGESGSWQSASENNWYTTNCNYSYTNGFAEYLIRDSSYSQIYLNNHTNYLDDGLAYFGYRATNSWESGSTVSITQYSTDPGYLRIINKRGSLSEIHVDVDWQFIAMYNTTEPSFSFGEESAGSSKPWLDYGADAVSPWQWEFTVPNGTGYYQFYSIGWFSGSNESGKSENESLMYYENDAPTLSNFNVSDGEVDVVMNESKGVLWNVTIEDPDGDTFDWTIECNNGNTSSGTDDTNGSKELSLLGLDYETTYTIWVNVSSGEHTVNGTYTFTTDLFPKIKVYLGGEIYVPLNGTGSDISPIRVYLGGNVVVEGQVSDAQPNPTRVYLGGKIAVSGGSGDNSPTSPIRVYMGGEKNVAYNMSSFTRYNTDWNYYKNITLNASQIPSDQSYFPVCINITDSDLASNAQADGDDILFASNFGAKLNHEIELYNSTTGHLVAWVNVTHLDAELCNISMYYGNAGASNQENVHNVWNDDYVAVYHFADLSDSTDNGYTIDTNSGCVLTDSDLGKGYDFERDDGDYMICSTLLDTFPSKVHLSAWLCPESVTSDSRMLYDWNYGMDDQFYSSIDTDYGGNLRFSLEVGNSFYSVDSSNTVSAGEYYFHSHLYEDNSVIKGWKDETKVTDGTSHGTMSSGASADFNIGSNRGEATNYDGIYDELRISDVARSDDWITTAYNSMNNATDGGFFSLGPQETGGWVNTVPSISNEHPSDGAINVSLNLALNFSHFNITVTDDNNANQSINVTWRTNESGAWLDMGYNESSNCNATFYCTNVSWVDTYNTTYWWSVNVSDNASGWSNATYSFTTKDSTNDPPTLTSPQCENDTNPDHLTNHNPQFSWVISDPEGDTQGGYELEIGNDSDWAVAEIYDSGEIPSISHNVTYNGTTPLYDGWTYYWRVRLKDDNGSTLGDWCATQNFVMNDAPSVPTLTSPANNSINLPFTTNSVNLTWSASTDNESDSKNYYWQYAEDSDFTLNKVQDWTGGPTYETVPNAGNLDKNTWYYWRVRAWDGVEYSSYSPWRKFFTDSNDPVNSNPYPSNTTTGVLLSLLTLNITVNDDGNNMTIYFRTNESGTWSTASVNSTVTNGTYYCYNTSWVNHYNTKYWWSVNTSDNEGRWDNDTYYFTTEVADTDNVYVNDDADGSWYNIIHVATISEAVTNVSNGGTIHVWEGTYTNSVTVDKNCTIVANSTALVSYEPSGSGFYITNDSVNISGMYIYGTGGETSTVSVNANNVYLHNLTIFSTSGVNKGLSYTDGKTNLTIDNATISTPITFFEGENLTIKNCTVNATGQIECYGVETLTITGCYIHNDSAYGVYLADDGSTYANTSNATIRNCIFENNSKGIQIDNEDVENILIYNNIFRNNTVHVDDGTAPDIVSYNVSKSLGTNIIGGDYFGGNYWDNYTGYDIDGDGLGQTSFTIRNNTDDLPLTENNSLVVFSSPNPANKTTSVSATISSWGISIDDADGNNIDWSIDTFPDIGNGSGTGEGNGTKQAILSGVQYSTNYSVYVNATDGTDPVNESFWFITGANSAPEFNNSVPVNESTGVSVSTTLFNVTIFDSNGDTFNWSIETLPSVGSNSSTGASNGSKEVTLTNLSYYTNYSIFVNATDGTDNNNETFWFITEADTLECDISTPFPTNSSSGVNVSVNISIDVNGRPGSIDFVNITLVGVNNTNYTSASNGTFYLDLNSTGDVLSYDHEYTWWVNASVNGTTNVTYYTFETETDPGTILVDGNADPSWYSETRVATIAEAITNVSSGGTIYVYNATYTEHDIAINKPLTMIGNSSAGVFIDAEESGAVMNITSDFVNISKMTLHNASTDIVIIHYCDNISIDDCIIIDSSSDGVFANSVDNVTISNATMYSIAEVGINVDNSSEMLIENNDVTATERTTYLYDCLSINVSSNVFHNQTNSSWKANVIYYSNYVNYSDNTIENTTGGGVHIFGTDNFTFYSNYVWFNNVVGLHCENADGGLVYNNYFSNTGALANAFNDSCTNFRWNASKQSGTNIIGGPYIMGNYWHDYAGVDENFDGIGETEYSISTSP